MTSSDIPDATGRLRFDGRSAIVTGGGRGLGRVYARHLAALGAGVIVNDIGVALDAQRYAGLRGEAAPFGADAHADDVADRVAAEIVAAGGMAIANRADVSQPAGACSAVDAALAAFGSVDIVINNAGIVPYATIEEAADSDLVEALAVHVGGAFNVTRFAWPHLAREGRGRVLNIASIEGVLIGNNGLVAYSAAKGGLWGLTMSLAVEGGARGINVNALLPGATTRANVSINPAAAARALERSPELTAPAALWLVHGDCETNGRCYATDAGNVRSVFASATRGYQSSVPAELTIEAVRDHWSDVEQREGACAPTDFADYNEFRNSLRR